MRTIFTWCKGDCGCELFLPDVEGAVLLANDSDTHCHASPEEHRYFYQWIFKLSGNVCRIKWAIMCKRRGVNMAIRSCHPAPPTLTRISQKQGCLRWQKWEHLHPRKYTPWSSKTQYVGVKPSCLGSAGDPREDRAGNHCRKDDWSGGEPRTQLSEGWDFLIKKI